ncbi:50S ribosomal protein L29 [Candidatus Marsarchaeota G2 archaeon ECH_B_SAG-F08]|uniref:Large ribosomal subunit protein uL29 n=3 Tax=Candidatus Marsarchaeota TaxID=1978152 RepID=A0A2R6AKB3_9ARCH|nr:MAG: 50S ribosomal protein L29 [Candidatus Marsarchaeota G1 archaeon BE_D]PSN88907.1 MAG: 50S ribosomal protein L29 [Candidatus Marsarchaeota G1 archaeon OSP_C]PSN97525.1 MAG: 50S ribosomal protein L29 [Candidatus Marsarchaeota G2 archaeon ECH_B_SAG-F08]
MKAEELRKLTDDELKNKLLELKKELFNERSNIYTRGASKNTKAIHELKKDIARVLTVLSERKKK